MRLGRLKRRPEFLRVARTGRRWAAPGLVLQAAPAASSLSSADIRFGLTATKKIGSAVTRNRARRRLRAAAEEVLPHHANSGMDYVLIARRATAHRPFPKLVADLETSLKRTGCYKTG